MIRKTLIGNNVKLPDGKTGRVTGITVEGIARVATGPAQWVDVPQDALTLISRKPASKK